MKDDSPQEHLSTLKENLYFLRSLSLPAEARLAVLRAIHNAERLEEYLPEEVEDTRIGALYKMSQILGTSLDTNEVLSQVMDAVIELTSAERGFLMLQDPHTGTLNLRAGRNIERETLEQKDMEVSRTVVQTVIDSGKGVVTTNAQTDPRFASQDSVIIFSLRSILCAPLRARGQIIGVIYVENRARTGIFTERDLEMLNTFAAQAAIAIENARLYTRTGRALNDRVAELETLTQIDRQLNAQLDIKRIVETIHRWAKTGTRSEQSWLILREQEGNLVMFDERGESIPFPGDEELEENFWRVMTSTSPESLSSTRSGSHRMVTPILLAGNPEGALIVDRSTPYADTDLQFLERLAGRASAAIENARLYEQVQRFSDAKTKFISVVTHELRVPMTSIRGYVDLLQAGAVGPTNEQQNKFLGIINSNIERMAALVSDLSDISRIEAGRLKLYLEFISLIDSLRETISSLAPELDESKYRLVIDVPEDLPDVYADSNRVAQVLSNLINNALKYASPEGQIMIHAHLQGKNVYLEVRDDGIGISQEDQAQLFTQFFRSEDQAVREQQGWGLGLNVAKSLVNLMGGEIGFESKVGEGSTFWFTLPITEPE